MAKPPGPDGLGPRSALRRSCPTAPVPRVTTPTPATLGPVAHTSTRGRSRLVREADSRQHHDPHAPRQPPPGPDVRVTALASPGRYGRGDRLAATQLRSEKQQDRPGRSR